MKTFTGRIIDPMNLKPEDIDIVDIAHHLSNMCRFNGGTKFHYSVAQHLVLCSNIPCSCLNIGAESEHTKKKLLHDAEEAYFVDVPRPIKRLPEFEFYRTKTSAVREFLFQQFGLTPDLPQCVHEADNAMLVREGIELMNHRYAEWGEPANFRIDRLTPEQAKDAFLERFRILFLE
jgi:uncharacterized protein